MRPAGQIPATDVVRDGVEIQKPNARWPWDAVGRGSAEFSRPESHAFRLSCETQLPRDKKAPIFVLA